MSAPLIVLTAGGTGGHVFPAEALAQVLSTRGYRLALITDTRGNRFGGTLGMVETHGVKAAQMLGRGILGKVRGGVSLLIGMMQARSILNRLRPEVVVGFGGYASVPAMGAAATLGLRTILHEQNAVLGRANRLFAGRVSRVATAFETVRALPEGATVNRIGMPVREAIRALHGTAYPALDDNGPIRLLILGGSQGARAFTDVLPDAFKALPDAIRRRLEISQQVRPEDMDRAQSAYAGIDFKVDLKSFFDDVPARLAACHLLIGRSGSSTVAEATVAGRPSLLVPYPYAADDHQTANARALEATGAAWLLPQSAMTPESTADRLASLLSDVDGLQTAARAATAAALPDAAERLADLVEELIPTARRATASSTSPTQGADAP